MPPLWAQHRFGLNVTEWPPCHYSAKHRPSPQLSHVCSEVKLPCASLYRHPLSRMLQPGLTHCQTRVRKELQPSEPAEGHGGSSRGGTKPPPAAGHPGTCSSTAQKAHHPPDTRGFFSSSLAPPPAELPSPSPPPNSVALLTSPFGKLTAQNSLTGTCF